MLICTGRVKIIPFPSEPHQSGQQITCVMCFLVIDVLFGFLGFCLLCKLIPAPLSAEGVSLRTGGGAWSCEYSLHVRNAGINVKLTHFWTFFQDLCNDGGGKMVYCPLSYRFFTHMTVLSWLYQSLNKMSKNGRTSGRRKKKRNGC